ncbi:S-layer homology domain-containing protein [Paenibacillus glycanilyticus]|uniref:SLH domain-containing protein n=1 Tax=Paenibacillus glycanilyticus TaxID=126569 RepID=A0ABQ6GB69_9BACL|nr:S-layer homology domain-containing protein [Paenibacillus glycanilyticus]GLX66902.1 hypothetical protein MU1_12460 [Paenibacillus glycanilyticus]
MTLKRNSRINKWTVMMVIMAMLLSMISGGLRSAYADSADNVLKIGVGSGVISHGWDANDIISGHEYTYSLEAMGTGTASVFVQYNWQWGSPLQYTDLAGSRVSIEPSANWTSYTGTFTAPEDQAGGADFYFGSATGGNVYVDNVVITDTTADETYYSEDFNSIADTPAIGKGNDSWYTTTTGIFSVVSKNDAVGPVPAVVDNYVLKADTGSGNMSWGTKEFAAGSTYTYSFQAMGSGTADIKFQSDENSDTPWSTLSGSSITVGPSTSWTTYTATFTTPAGQPEGAGYYMFISAASAGQVYINNMTVTDAEGATFFADGFENVPNTPIIGKGNDNWYTGTNGIFSVVPISEAAGTSSKVLRINSGEGNVTAHLGELVPGDTYEFNLEGIGYSSADFKVENKSWATLSQLSVAASNTWQNGSVTFVVPDDDQNDYTLVVNAASGGNVYVDNIVITDTTADTVLFQEDFENVPGDPAIGTSAGAWYTNTDGTMFTIVPRNGASGSDPNASAIVDKYGQMIDSPYTPNDNRPHAKITSDEELAMVPEQNESYFSSLSPPTDRDSYGGLAGSGSEYGFEATGYFYSSHADVNNDGNPEAVMVDPLGNLYFQLGATVTDPNETYADLTGIKWEYDQLPAYDPDSKAWRGEDTFSPYVYNIEQETGKPFDVNAWREDQIYNEKQLGFNSLGMWSGDASTTTPYFEVLDSAMAQTPHIGSSRLFDVFSPNWQSSLNAGYGGAISGHANDKMLIGYMFENELPYDSFSSTLLGSSSVGSGTRNELASWMSDQYGDDIAAFNTAWKTNFSSFNDLASGTLKMSTSAASSDINNFTKYYLQTEYSTIYQTGKAYDPNHMQLGDRWFAGSLRNTALAQDLAEATAGNVDAITYNYYTNSLDTAWLKQIYDWSDSTPIILSEWHYSDTSVLPNGSQPVSSPTAKGQMYSDYLENAIATGVVVGSDWFTWLDQAPTGRYFNGPNNGESGAYGFVDVTNRPVEAFNELAMQNHYNVYKLLAGSVKPYAAPNRSAATERDTHKVMAAPQTATAPVIGDFADWSDFSKKATLTAIDQVSGPAIPDPNVSGNMAVTWDNENFYIQARVTSGTNRAANGGVAGNPADMWNGDGLELFFGPQDVASTPGSMLGTDSQLLLGVNKNSDGSVSAAAYWVNGPSFASQSPVNVKAKLASDNKGWILEAAIPLSAIGLPADAFSTDGSLVLGTPMRYDMGFDLSGAGGTRYSQYAWNGNDSDSKNRNPWGMLHFAAKEDDGGTTTTPPPTPTGGTTSSSLTPILDPATGEASLTIPTSYLSSLLSGTNKPTIVIPAVNGARGYNVSVPASLLQSLPAGKAIVIQTAAGTLTIPSGIQSGIGSANAATVTLSIKTVTTDGMDDSLKASIGDHPVIDLSLKLDGKVVTWNDPDHPITVSVPYKPSAAELADPEHITIWYIDGQGKAIAVPNAKYDSATGSVNFMTTHFSEYAVVFVQKSFTDLAGYDWAKKQIEILASKGVISQTKFAPGSSMTRADFAVSLMKALGLSAKSSGTFEDVAAADSRSELLNAAKALGIIKGGNNNLFHPDAPITRQDMMVMAARALEKLGKLEAPQSTATLAAFKDKAQVSGYALQNLASLVEAGLIHGSAGKLNPGQAATRAEAAVFLYNLYLK